MSDDKEKRQQETKLLRQSMEIIERGEQKLNRRTKYDDLGLCGRCMFLHAELTQYGTRRHWCTELHRRVSSSDPIIDCTDFSATGQMPLSMLMTLARPIEVEKKKKVGFIYDEDNTYGPEDYETIDL